jgi:elongation factor Ts
MAITAQQVMQLREETNLPLMKVKEALNASNGDKQGALDYLKKQGAAFIIKINDNEMPHGAIGMSITETNACLVVLGCQTDFVANNEEFKSVAKDLASRPYIDLDLTDVVAKFRENIKVKTKKVLESSETFVGYNHGTVAAIVCGSGDKTKLHQIALHIVSSNVIALDRSGISDDVIAKEKQLISEMPDVISKPEQFRSKIIEGKLNKGFFAKNVLLDQEMLFDNLKGETVAQYCNRNNLKIESYIKVEA